jgi:two-component system chemotaxis response regulator CheY
MKRGLIVDDATVMRMRLRDILQTRFEVVGEAENGQRALELYAQLKPDFVTMDITMAEMNGMDALKNLVARHPEAKVVMVSAMGQKAMVFEALSQGARDFIIKPFDPDRVVMAINRLFD